MDNMRFNGLVHQDTLGRRPRRLACPDVPLEVRVSFPNQSQGCVWQAVASPKAQGNAIPPGRNICANSSHWMLRKAK